MKTKYFNMKKMAETPPNDHSNPDAPRKAKSKKNWGKKLTGTVKSLWGEFKALFSKESKSFPKIGGHLGISTEDLGWDKKTTKKWIKILREYVNRNKTTEKQATSVFFHEVESYAEANPKYISFFWQEIWENRKHKFPEISQICFKLSYSFINDNIQYFMKRKDLVFQELKNEAPDFHKMAVYIIKQIWKKDHAWFKDDFLTINTYLMQNRTYLIKKSISPQTSSKKKIDLPKSTKRKYRRKGKSKSTKTNQKDTLLKKPHGIDIYYFLWTELIDKFPDLITTNWDQIFPWLLYYEPMAQKQANRAIRANIKRNPPKLIEYQIDLLLTNIEIIIEGQLSKKNSLNITELRQSLINNIASLLLTTQIEGKKHLKEKLMGYLTFYLRENPSILSNYHLISSWVNQAQCPILPNIVFREIYDQIVDNNQINLCDIYFNDFYTHLSYGNDLTIKKTIDLFYFLHNNHNYFAEPAHFQRLVFALDQEHPKIQKHVHYLIFTILKKNPRLIGYLKPKIEIALKHPENIIKNSVVFFLKVLNELILMYANNFDILTYFIDEFGILFIQEFESKEIVYLIANFFLLIAENQIELLQPYRDWIEDQISQHAKDFELKEIFSKIRMRLIRSQLKIKKIQN